MSLRTLFSSAVVLAACVTMVAHAAVNRPFKGHQVAEITYVGTHGDDNEYLDIVATGTGQYTHMGSTTFEIEATINLITGAGWGTSTYTGSNGDQIFNTFTTQALNADETYFEVTTIGGTGKFENVTGFATGIGTVTSRTDFGSTQRASFQGTFSY